MNVEIKSNDDGRKVLRVTKDIEAGETIYKEYPVVAVLDADLESSGKYCSHCFRALDFSTSSTAFQLPENQNPLGSTFCSEHCLNTNKSQSTSLLFTQEPPLPPELAAPNSPALDVEGRKAAQDKFVEYVKKEKRAGPLLVARFIARQVALETAKLAGKMSDVTAAGGSASASAKAEDAQGKKKEDFTDAEEGDYLLADHMERLRYLGVKPNEEELPLISAVLEKTLPGLEQFVTEERHATLLGKMAYNAIGVGYREDKPESTARPEDIEKTRTPTGTQHQLGSAFYTLSSYANHSCTPSAKLTFPSNTTELHLISTRALKKGDEITVAFVDVNQHDNESGAEARRRRRIELARGWRFACGCEKCEEEGRELSKEEKEGEKEKEEVVGDESKVEESARRFEEREKEIREEKANDVE
ncbi:hypothetical protein NP233_g2271 [Leucocoprinus birnbaumii]|uniref:SET domain-containing protein n=1 Tax=Leucocoprinus birnbaumii TaxID=56174 RepID=A0AAD5YYY5_9AGAR|nr:hypothetical protein NP233_g2271 [Leucocoprinus birnbaumii]